jgi:hypothetical protein
MGLSGEPEPPWDVIVAFHKDFPSTQLIMRGSLALADETKLSNTAG